MLKSILQTTKTKLPNVLEVIFFQCKDVINVFAFLRLVILFVYLTFNNSPAQRPVH